MSEQTPIVRQWTLLRMLSSRRYGLTIKEIARELGVADKTIRRDLDLLRTLGMPIEEEVLDRGLKRYRNRGDWMDRSAGFAFDEALSLYLGRRFLEPLAGTVFWDAAQRAFRKIRAMLGERALAYLEQCAGAFHATTVGAGDYARKSGLIDDLMLAVEDGKAVHITYTSREATEPATRDVYPYGMVYHRGSLYLVAFAPEHGAVRHYKVDRIEAVEISPWPFRRPDGFDLARHLAGSFGVYHGSGDEITVRVRFAAEVARYVSESRWHHSQRLAAQPDGSLLAEFRLTCTEELRSWVLSFGPKAAVLEPESLREAIRADLLRTLHGYAALPPALEPRAWSRRAAGGSPAKGGEARASRGAPSPSRDGDGTPM